MFMLRSKVWPKMNRRGDRAGTAEGEFQFRVSEFEAWKRDGDLQAS
jgi:hypothetical protein